MVEKMPKRETENVSSDLVSPASNVLEVKRQVGDCIPQGENDEIYRKVYLKHHYPLITLRLSAIRETSSGGVSLCNPLNSM